MTGPLLRIPVRVALQPRLILCVPAARLAEGLAPAARFPRLPTAVASVLGGHTEPIDVRVYDQGRCPDDDRALRKWLLSCAALLGEEARFLMVLTNDANRRPRSGLWAVMAMALVLARGLPGCLILDPDASRSLSLPSSKSFFTTTTQIRAADHIGVYDVGARIGRACISTIGMVKFGLPELELRDLPDYATPLAPPVLQACAQRPIARALDAVAADSGVRHVDVPDRLWVDRAPVARATGMRIQGDRSDGVEVGLDYRGAIRIGPPPRDHRHLGEWILSAGGRLLAPRLAA